MTPGAMWHEIGAGETFLTRLLRLLFLCLAALVFYFFAILPLTWPQQAVLGLLTLIVGLAMSRSSDSYLITLTLMLLSSFCTVRYGYWRVAQAIRFFRDPATHWGALDAFFILCLLLAEVYAFFVLFLGYFQTIWPLRRAPIEMPDDPEEWPHIDVVIPTYNEPLDVVRFTVFGALNMDWPADKLHIYLLDDGHREEFKEFAGEVGIGYRSRPDNVHAKAGNINAALKTLKSPFVAIFDSDHVPTRSFLQMTVGWFLHDPKLGILQTPHHFYSPDPFERNLEQFRLIPNEGELFYGIVQDGNDFWNASYFCGSCAVLRRSALDEIGGMAVETVTEDAHTSLRMQMAGWSTAYINIPQAAGLATERLSQHVGQRIRWARGMVQILRTDNPLTARGLNFPQRLCYFNAMAHFLYAIPRLIFLTAPLIYLLLSHTNIPGAWQAILAYALPHLTLSNVTNSRIQGEHRHSFWNEIYETVLAPYILLPTVLALISPRMGKFNVTSKGGVVRRTFFDSKIAQPFLIMLLFNIAGLVMAIPRLFYWDTGHEGTVIMNVIWCLFNLVILGVCTAVARELRQLRTTVRISVVTPVVAKLPGNVYVSGETLDMSSGGTSIQLDEPVQIDPDEEIRLAFPMPNVGIDLPATVVGSEGNILRVRFENLTISEQETLTMVLYSRADSWLGWGESREPDDVLRSLGRIFTISIHGLSSTFRNLFTRDETREESFSIARLLVILFMVSVGLAISAPLAAQSQVPASGAEAGASRSQVTAPLPQKTAAEGQLNLAASSAAMAPGQYVDRFTLADAGSPQIELHGIDTIHNVYFTLPQTHVPAAARIHLSYAFSPSLLPQISHLKLIVNGTLIATVQPIAGATGGSDGHDAEADFPIPADLLVHNNTLTIEFIGHYTQTCEDTANSAIWARVHRTTYLEIQGTRLPLADDLNQLPTPFLDPAVVQSLSLPIVFPSSPSPKAIQAAGVVASYFGLLAEGRPVRFPVHIGSIPSGNAIVVAAASNLPPELGIPQSSAPTVAVRTNPNDAFGKLLIITGPTAGQALVAAQAVALHSDMLYGSEATIQNLRLPAKQAPDAGPRWARVDKKIPLWDYSSEEQLQGDGTSPLNVYFRIPPDLYYGEQGSNATLHLIYRYNSVPIGPISSLQVRVNNAFIQSVPLTPGQETSRQMQTDIAIPIVNLRPFSNSLTFDFTFQQLRKGGCEVTTPINLQGAVLRDSYIDISGYPHFASLPNLEIFANAGFPFTRFADLSETTVVLPSAPTEQEIETYVTLMGHFGRQTGYPALRVNVAGSEVLRSGADADFLVIGSDDDQPAFDRLQNNLPVSLRSGEVQVRDTQGFFTPILHHAWWKTESTDRPESGELIASGAPQAIIEGIESPFQPGRSIVVIHLKDNEAFTPFMDTFLDVQQASDIAGSVAVLKRSDGTAQFQSFRIGTSVYHVGQLPWWTRLTLWFTEVPWLAAVIVIAFAFLLAIWTRQWLRNKARARLRMSEEE